MKTNLWIARSQRFYRWLLRLYPQAHREVYEAEMFRMFTSQCQDAYKQRGKVGILSLWPRTLFDLGVTVVHEHLTDPHAKLGLLEANPHAPLPWKGVLLLLIPGLVFFISQIAQLTSITLDWFYLAYYRAAYYLIVPVLVVWLLTRRFPVWGLPAFGLLYATLWSYSQRVQLTNLPIIRDMVADGLPEIWNILIINTDVRYFLLTTACVLFLACLIGYNMRRNQVSKAAWRWLGLYVLLAIFQVVAHARNLIAWEGLDWLSAFHSTEVRYFLIGSALWYLYHSLPFLLLIFIGLFFARQHGRFSFFLLLGYLLPTIVFGRYGEWNDALPFYLVSTGILLYRFIVALVAPIWLARAASTSKSQRAAAIPVAVAIASQIVLNVVNYLATTDQTGFSLSLMDFVLLNWDQLIVAAGLGLAVALYVPGDQKAVQPPLLVRATE